MPIFKAFCKTGQLSNVVMRLMVQIKTVQNVLIFEYGVNVNTTTLTRSPENTQDFSFNQPQAVCQHTAYSPSLLVIGR